MTEIDMEAEARTEELPGENSQGQQRVERSANKYWGAVSPLQGVLHIKRVIKKTSPVASRKEGAKKGNAICQLLGM